MTLYLILAAAILMVSTALTFSSEVVTNKHLLIHLVLFPLVYILCGLPIGQLVPQFMMAGLMFIFGLFAFYYSKIGGGAARALIITALWVPGLGLFFNYLTMTLIVIGIVAAFMFKFSQSDRMNHFATLVFGCCSAFLFYQYNQPTLSAPTATAIQQVEIISTQPSLRGLKKN